MGTATATADTLDGVEMFAVGRYEQSDGTVQVYGEDYLAKVLANFGRLSVGPTPLHRVPVVIGHEGQEAYGWVASVARAPVHEGAKLVPGLKGNWSEVEPSLRKAVKAGRYKKVSVEFKDDFKGNDGTSYGPCLWRVAVLGSDVPKVKGLSDLPAEQFADKSHSKFAEVSAMDRAAATAYLVSMGIDEGMLKDVPDEVLIAIAQAWQAKEAAAQTGQDAAGGGAMSDPTGAGRSPTKTTVTQQFAETPEFRESVKAEVARQLASVNQQMALVNANLKAGERATQTFAEKQKRQLVEKAVHEAVFVKRTALPREDDAALGPNRLSERLMRKDHSRIHKFSEGGVAVEKTELEMEIDALLNHRPEVRAFADKVKAGTGGVAGASVDPAEAHRNRVKAYYQRGAKSA